MKSVGKGYLFSPGPEGRVLAVESEEVKERIRRVGFWARMVSRAFFVIGLVGAVEVVVMLAYGWFSVWESMLMLRMLVIVPILMGLYCLLAFEIWKERALRRCR